MPISAYLQDELAASRRLVRRAPDRLYPGTHFVNGYGRAVLAAAVPAYMQSMRDETVAALRPARAAAEENVRTKQVGR